MTTIERDAAVIGAAVIGLVFLLNYVKNHAGELAAAVPGIVADTAGGVVLGVGDVLGVPRTDLTACEMALREGRTWDASFACPAGTFVRSVFD